MMQDPEFQTFPPRAKPRLVGWLVGSKANRPTDQPTLARVNTLDNTRY
jgi:hypothetical protein